MRMTFKWFKYILVLVTLSIGTASAQPLTDWNKRLQVSANGSGMWFSQTGLETDNWRGGDLGGSLTYSLHKALSTYVTYDHGFPLDSEDGHKNFIRIVANLRVYPSSDISRTERSNYGVFVGAGKGWFGGDGVKEFTSYEAQTVVARKIHPRAAIFGLYSHSFLSGDVPGFDFMKFGLTTKLFP